MKNALDIFRGTPSSEGTWDPFRALRRLEREMDEMLRVPVRREEGAEETSFVPACDMSETSKHYLLSFDLPGISKDQVDIELRGNELHVCGERERERKDESGGRFISERDYGRFDRYFLLPTDVNTDKIEANYQDGVLKIAIPRVEGANTKKVQIGEAKSGWWDRLIGKGEEKKEKEADAVSKAA